MIEKHTSLEGVTEYRLDNGLRVLLIPDPSQATVTVNLTIFAGSACENYGESGAAHLLEHLAFKGSPDFENVPAALNEHGASWNGTTWTDRTNYYETMPSSDQNLDFGIHFEAARMARSYIRAEDLASEMSVVRNEYEAGENYPTQVLSERMTSSAFLFHGYGHSTIGARSDIEGVPIERLKRFYKTWYRPDNALLIVAGRFEEDKALDSIGRHFGPIPRPEIAMEQAPTVEPAQDGERSVILRRVGEVGAVGVVYHVPGGAHAHTAAVEVINEILAAAPTGRLYRSLVETKMAARVASYAYLFRDPSLIEVVAEVRKDGDLEAVRAELLTGIESLGEEPPSTQEVERAKNALLKDRTLVYAKSERFAIELSEWAGLGDWRMFFVHRDRLEKVTAADVQLVANAYLRRNNRTVGMFFPTDAAEPRIEIPAVGDLTAVLSELERSRDGQSLEAESLEVNAKVLEERTRRESLVDGAVKLSLLSKKTRGQLASGRVSVAVCNAEDLPSRRFLNDYVGSMLDRGTTKHDRAGLKDEFDRLRADVRVHGESNGTVVTFTTIRDHVGEVLDLTYEMLREPAFDPTQLELLRQERLAELEEESREPSAIAWIDLHNHMYPPAHLRHTPALPDQIDFAQKIDVDQLRDYHLDYYGAHGFVSVVGDFDEDQVLRRVASLSEGWTSRRQSSYAAVSPPPACEVLSREIETPDKENGLTVAGCTFALRQDDPDYEPLILANYLLGGEALNSRLAQRLRQKDGLCYGAGSSVSADELGDLGTFTFWAISAPQNAVRVEQGMREELARVCADGFTSDELERSRTAYLEQLEVRLSRNRALAAEMTGLMLRGKTFAELERTQTALRAATIEQVNEVAARFLSPDRLTLVRAGDFARAREREAAVASSS